MTFSAPSVPAPGQSVVDEAPVRRLVTATFRPAASYLLDEPLRPRRANALIRVDDTDVGPLLTEPGDSIIGQTLRTLKRWEPNEDRVFRQTLRPGMNVIDVGANIGYLTLLMARLVGPHGRVLAIEAEPETFTLLRANIALSGLQTIEALPVAAGRTSGLVNIERNMVNQGGNMATTRSTGAHVSPVQVVRIDEVLDPATPVHFIKVDVEGMDLDAVLGLAATIARWRPTILVEFNPVNIERLGLSPVDVFPAYRALGFDIRLVVADILWMKHSFGERLDPLVSDNLLVTPENESLVVDLTRQVGCINLILTPRIAPDVP